MAHIAPINRLSNFSGALASTAWDLVDHRTIVVDDIVTQFELLQRTSYDRAGTPHRTAYARVRLPSGMQVMHSTAMTIGMTDAQITSQIRIVMQGRS